MQRQTIVSANAPAAEALAASSLLDSFILRAQRANLSSKDKRMGTSLGKYESLLRTLPNLRQLRPLSFPGDYATSIANEAILCTLAEYMRSLPNRSADTPVKGSGIADYVSAVKCLAEEHFSTPVLCSGGGLTLRRGLMNMRREDGASGQRDLSAPLFNSHIVQLASPDCAFDCTSWGWPATRWALFQCSLHCFLRGGEAGRLDNQPYRPASSGISWSDLVWDDPTTGHAATVTDQASGLLYFLLTVMVVPIKYLGMTQQKRVPCIIRSKHPASAGLHDITCPYTAIRRDWAYRSPHVPASVRKTTPFFVGLDGITAVCTKTMRDAARDAARCLHLIEKEYGGSTWRRGGATDVRNKLGSAAGKALIVQRGRWGDYDMDDIYARASVAEHAHASGAISSSQSRTLEQAFPGYVQPTHF